MNVRHHRVGWFGRTARGALSLLVAWSLLPAPAFASKLATDLVGGYALSTPRITATMAPDVSARAGTLIGFGGRSLWARGATSERPMASTTKVMTALVVLERCDLDDVVTVSSAAAKTPYALGLRAGERRTVRQLLELLLVASSNDAATALAEHAGGTVRSFAYLMNSRARALQMTDTHYVNPHGLDAAGHYTSAEDLTRVARAALGHAEFKRIIHLGSVMLPRFGTRPARRVENTNELVGHMSGLIGGKTGYTDDADYCLVATARREGVTLTSVVLGSPTSSARFSSSRRLLEWGFRYYRLRTLCTTTQTVGAVPVSQDPSRTVQVRFGTTVVTPVFSLMGPVTRAASLDASVPVPVFPGQRLGVVRFLQDSSVIATAPVVAAASVASAGEVVGAVPVLGRLGLTVTARAGDTTAAVAPYDTSRTLKRRVALVSGIAAPIAKGAVLGWITYHQDGRLIVRVPAVAVGDVSAD